MCGVSIVNVFSSYGQKVEDKIIRLLVSITFPPLIYKGIGVNNKILNTDIQGNTKM